MLCTLVFVERLLVYITTAVCVCHMKHVKTSSEFKSPECLSALTVSQFQHGSVTGVAFGPGRGSSLRSRFAETLFPVFLDRSLVSAEGDKVRCEAGTVQADI